MSCARAAGSAPVLIVLPEGLDVAAALRRVSLLPHCGYAKGFCGVISVCMPVLGIVLIENTSCLVGLSSEPPRLAQHWRFSDDSRLASFPRLLHGPPLPNVRSVCT